MRKDKILNKIYTVAEVANMTRVNKRQIYNYLHTGVIPRQYWRREQCANGHFAYWIGEDAMKSLLKE